MHKEKMLHVLFLCSLSQYGVFPVHYLSYLKKV